MIKHNSDLQINTYFKRDVEFLYEKIDFFIKYINVLEYYSIHFFILTLICFAEGDGHINIWLIVTVAKIWIFVWKKSEKRNPKIKKKFKLQQLFKKRIQNNVINFTEKSIEAYIILNIFFSEKKENFGFVARQDFDDDSNLFFLFF